MPGLVRENLFEALVGVLVVLLAVWFLYFAWDRTGGGGLDRVIEVNALFPAANGVSVGTDVRIAGLKIGTVSGQKLDRQSWQAELTLALDKDVVIPSDSSAAITTEGLLGGTYIAVQPGGSETPLKNGDTIIDTQGSMDMMGLIGSFINNSGGSSKSSDKADSGGTETPAAQ